MIKNYELKYKNAHYWLRRNTYRLQHLGAAMMIIGLITPFLITMKVIPNSYCICFLSAVMTTSGSIFYIVGIVWNNLIDRSQ